MTYWHGGSRIEGDMVLPGDETGMSRSGDAGVFITSDRSLAETYASTVVGSAWVYEVQPLSDPVPVPSLVGGPTISFRCDRAQIIRRFTVSNAARLAYRAAIWKANHAEAVRTKRVTHEHLAAARALLRPSEPVE